MITNSTHQNMLISPARSIGATVELYNGSTKLNTFNHTDSLKSLTVSRAGGNKFFGYGISQEVEMKLIDTSREINIVKGQELRIKFIANNSSVTVTPKFFVEEVNRDENTNELTVKAYDKIYAAKNKTVADLNLVAPYTITAIIRKITTLLGVNVSFPSDRTAFNIEYTNGANFDGSETLREVLDAIAEATQTIYYINRANALKFKYLSLTGDPVLTIRKDDYFTLKSKESCILSSICSATELGDNVIVSATGVTGETQYVRNNPFWELREDIDTLLKAAIARVGRLMLNQFDCKWRGNYLLEPGDMIAITTKDDDTVVSYLLNDKYTYDGGLSAETTWEYSSNNGESAANPVTLKDALQQTYAKVDKANKKIEIVASNVQANSEEISSLEMTTETITASVSKMDNDITNITNQVSTKMSAEDVSISIQTALDSGVEKVTTATGFTFNEEGLHISKTDSEITTSITEDGMTVYKNNNEVLVADNLGVRAEDLHATTFLIVGNNSRFEDYKSNRTGCFFIGN